MHRKNLITLLNEYFPSCQEELALKEKLLHFINEYEDCFERSLEVGHITASSWLLSKDQSKALLMHHSKLDRWLQLGRHCDGDSNVLDVAIKEAQEESGIEEIEALETGIFDIDIHLIPENADSILKCITR